MIFQAVAPGEKLLTKMWETLAEKGIGGLLMPWQTRRVGRATTDVKRDEMLMLAQAERDADDIRAGRKVVGDDRRVRALPVVTEVSPYTAAEVIAALEARISSVVLADALRKEVNVSKALLAAEAELENDPQEPPDRNLDTDWLYRWRECAGAVSSEELQQLWGRLLAGEVKSPGAFALRTMDLLRNLSTDDARKIESLGRFVIDDWILREEAFFLLNQFSISFFLEMQELGILSGVESIGLRLTFTSVETDKYRRALISNDRALVITHEDPSKKFEMPAYKVTSVGSQLFRLGKFEADQDYLRSIAQQICALGFQVSLARWTRVDRSQIRIYDEQKIC